MTYTQSKGADCTITCESNIERQAIATYGKENQLIVAIEELSELQKELCKALRNKANIEHIVEEMADVDIIFNQLKIIFEIGENEIEANKRYKLNRLRDRINKCNYF